jgi:hypothetical protein
MDLQNLGNYPLRGCHDESRSSIRVVLNITILHQKKCFVARGGIYMPGVHFVRAAIRKWGRPNS